jgi:hypothetical protein
MNGMDDKRHMTAQSTKERAQNDFSPIRAWAKGNAGAINRLTERVREKSGGKVNRHMIGRWLAETDPVEPGYGYGVYLIEAYRELSEEPTTEG